MLIEPEAVGMNSQSKDDSDRLGTEVYRTTIQCDECLEHFSTEFDNPNETFSATCPSCGAHYPEVYV